MGKRGVVAAISVLFFLQILSHGGFSFSLTGAPTVSLAPFIDQRGGEFSVLSDASRSGFTRNVIDVPEDHRVITRAELANPLYLAEGEQVALTFTFDSTQIKPDQGAAFGWGFRFGNRSVIVTVRTGTPQWTFLSHRFTADSGFEFTIDGSDETKSFHASEYAIPSSNSWFAAGNTVEVETILRRIQGSAFQLFVHWGGQIYSSYAFHFAEDESYDLQSVFFRSGGRNGPVSDIGDMYTLSGIGLVHGVTLDESGGTGRSVSPGAVPAEPFEIGPVNLTNTLYSGETTSGFSMVYTGGIGSDTRTYGRSLLNVPDQHTMKIGESLRFSFDVNSDQMPVASQAFRWGFDTGVGLFVVIADTGAPDGTFLQHRYGDVWQFGSTHHSGSWQVSSAPIPDSSAWIAPGKTAQIESVLTRDDENDWTLSTSWGGNTYTSSIEGYETDGSIEHVWVGSGTQTGSVFNPGDNYTVSNVRVQPRRMILDLVLNQEDFLRPDANFRYYPPRDTGHENLPRTRHEGEQSGPHNYEKAALFDPDAGYAVRYWLGPQETEDGKARAEHYLHVAELGETVVSEFSMMLDPEFTVVDTFRERDGGPNWVILRQWHQSAPESPPIALHVESETNNQIVTSIRFGKRRESHARIFRGRKTLELGTWYHFRYLWRVAPGTDEGRLKVWVSRDRQGDLLSEDDVLFDYSGPIGYTLEGKPEEEINEHSYSIREQQGLYQGPHLNPNSFHGVTIGGVRIYGIRD